MAKYKCTTNCQFEGRLYEEGMTMVSDKEYSDDKSKSGIVYKEYFELIEDAPKRPARGSKPSK